MALTLTLVDTWDDGKRIHVSGAVAASGSYVTSGDALDLSQFPIVATTHAPFRALPRYSGKVKIFQQGASAAAFPELAAFL